MGSLCADLHRCADDRGKAATDYGIRFGVTCVARCHCRACFVCTLGAVSALWGGPSSGLCAAGASLWVRVLQRVSKGGLACRVSVQRTALTSADTMFPGVGAAGIANRFRKCEHHGALGGQDTAAAQPTRNSTCVRGFLTDRACNITPDGAPRQATHIICHMFIHSAYTIAPLARLHGRRLR
jgi:hypothetical protein